MNTFAQAEITFQQISDLQQDWNGYGAQPINQTVIKHAKVICYRLGIVPEIFPTARNSVHLQVEYNDTYFEIEVTDKDLQILIVEHHLHKTTVSKTIERTVTEEQMYALFVAEFGV